MRLDKFLKVSRIIKRRTVANDACDNAHVTVNGRPAKASYDVKQNDIIERSENSVSILLGIHKPFVLQIKLMPIQYKFTVAKQNVEYSHFDVYEKQPIEYILTTQQIIQQERYEYEQD